MPDIWGLIVRSLEEYWQNTLSVALGPLLLRVVAALIIAGATLLVARFAGRAVQRSTQQASDEADFALLAGRLAHLGVSALGAGWVLSILGVPLAALAGFFGFFGLGISMSLADILKSLIAGAYLLIERPYDLGDMVTVRGFEGTVGAIRLRTTRLRMTDGREVLIPNSIMLTEALVASSAPASR